MEDYIENTYEVRVHMTGLHITNMSASEAPISTPAVTAYTPQTELDFQLWIHRPEHKNRWRMSPEKAHHCGIMSRILQE